MSWIDALPEIAPHSHRSTALVRQLQSAVKRLHYRLYHIPRIYESQIGVPAASRRYRESPEPCILSVTVAEIIAGYRHQDPLPMWVACSRAEHSSVMDPTTVEGTFLMWLDFTGPALTQEALREPPEAQKKPGNDLLSHPITGQYHRRWRA